MKVEGRIAHQDWEKVPKNESPFKDLLVASFEQDEAKMRAALVAHPELVDEAARRLSPWSLRELFKCVGDEPKLQADLLDHAIVAGGFKQGQLLDLRKNIPIARQRELLAQVSGEARARLERVGYGAIELPNAPPTIRADHTRLEAASEAINPLVRAFVDAHVFAPRIAAVRAGEPGLALDEQPQIRASLETLDAGQRKALRDAMVAKHPALSAIASHAAVKGPPTVEALLDLLSGMPFKVRPPMSVELQADFDDVLAQLPDHLSREKWTARLLGSKGLIEYAAAFEDRWTMLADKLSPMEIDRLQLGEYKRGSTLRDLERWLSGNFERSFKAVRETIDKVGIDRFARFFERYLSFEPGHWGMNRLLGFKNSVAEKALGFEKFANLIDLIAEDDRSAFLRRVAQDHGFDTIIEKAKTLDETELAAWFKSAPKIDADGAAPPERIAVSGGSLGRPVALEEALIQKVRNWPPEQSAKYGPEMAAVVRELEGKLKGGEIKTFQEALAFLGPKVAEVAGRVLPENFPRGLFDPPDEGRTAWGRPRTSLRYSMFPKGSDQSAEGALSGRYLWTNGARDVVLTIASRMPNGPLLFHTPAAEIARASAEVEPVFARALAARDPEVAAAAVAEIHWWAANIMPFERGSAGAIDALAKALLGVHGIKSGAWKSDISPDIQAMVTPLAEFVRTYSSFFEG